MFLLGRQAMLGHDPPIYLRSITATRCPCAAKVHAAMVDPVPPPRITKSYSSTLSFCPEGVFWVGLMPCSQSGALDTLHALYLAAIHANGCTCHPSCCR